MSLRTSRGGFEGLGLQAKSRPAACRRIPPSPPRFIASFPSTGDGHPLNTIDDAVPTAVGKDPQPVTLEVPKSKRSS